MTKFDRSGAGRVAMAALFCLLSWYANAGEKLLVYTVNYPLQSFAERIAGEHAEVHFPAPARIDPAFWEPDLMPGEQEWERLVYAQEAFPALWMLWQDAPSAVIRARLQSLGIDVVVFQSCANRPPQGGSWT